MNDLTLFAETMSSLKCSAQEAKHSPPKRRSPASHPEGEEKDNASFSDRICGIVHHSIHSPAEGIKHSAGTAVFYALFIGTDDFQSIPQLPGIIEEMFTDPSGCEHSLFRMVFMGVSRSFLPSS